ncbi:MAG TPA: MFS transporter [Magnetospirillaceae bacterium]|nr:MFS transporter [Magnetospirillaceae bacterium]
MSTDVKARRIVVAAMMLTAFLAAVEGTVTGAIMPVVVGAIGGFELFSWTFGAYLIVAAIAMPVYGRLADHHGRKALFLTAIVLFLLGCWLCGMAHTMPQLIAFRAVQALGAAGMTPLAITIIGDVTTPAERPHYLGYVSAIWGFAAIVAPLMGAWLVDHFSWSYVFWMPLPVGVPVIAVVLLWFEETGKHHQSGQRTGILQLDLWRTPVVRIALLSGFLCGAELMAVTAFVPSFLTGVLDGAPMAGAIAIGLMSVAWTCANMSISRIMRKFRYRSLAVRASVGLAVATALLWTGAELHQPVLIYLACVGAGLGMGINSITFNVAVQSNVPGRERGQATTLFYLARTLGQAAGSTVLGLLLNLLVSREAPDLGAVDELMRSGRHSPVIAQALDHGLDVVFFCSILLSLAILAAGWLTPKTLEVSHAVDS